MSLSKEEIMDELERCSDDPIYFIEKYVNVVHPIKGVVPFELYRFQQRIVSEMVFHRFNIIRKFRQAGITTLNAAYALWSIIFKEHHTVMIVSIGDRESTDVLSRIVGMYKDLPSWLRPAIKEQNKHTLRLSTDSVVKSQPAGAGRGQSVSHLIVDEAAFIDKMREFWAAIYPTVSTGGKVTMISTVNGMGNLFYELYQGAIKGDNMFNVVDIRWQEHPEYTEEWAKDNRPIIGERMWLQEYECEFLGTGDTFIDYDTLRSLNESVNDKYATSRSNMMRIWELPVPYKQYLLCADASFGRGRDFSAFHIIDLYNGNQVAEFYSNKIGLKDLASIIAEEGNRYNLAHVVIERNGLGLDLINRLFEDEEYENLWMDESNNFGMLMTQKTRDIVLSHLEDYVRTHKFKINSNRTFDEFTTFVIDDNGKIKADEGFHDDLIMSLGIGSFVYETLKHTNVGEIDSSEKEDNEKDPYVVPLQQSKYNDDDFEDTKWVLN